MAAPAFRAAAGGGAGPTNPATVTYPTGTITNDTVLAVVFCGAAGTTPTGWVVLATNVGGALATASAVLLSRRVGSDTSVTFPADWAGASFGVGVALFTYTQCDIASPSGVDVQNQSGTSQTFPALVGPATLDYTAVRILQTNGLSSVTSAGTGWTTRNSGITETPVSAKAACMDKPMVGGGTAASSACAISPTAAAAAFVVALSIPPAGYSMVI